MLYDVGAGVSGVSLGFGFGGQEARWEGCALVPWKSFRVIGSWIPRT